MTPKNGAKTTISFIECTKYAIISNAVAFHGRAELGNMDGYLTEGFRFFDDFCKGVADCDKVNVLLAAQNLGYVDRADVEIIFFKGIVGHNNTMSNFINDILAEVF